MKFLEELKGFDINSLDFKNLGTWPRPIMAIACVLVLVVVLVLGYYYHVSEVYSNLNRVKQDETKLKKTFESKASEASALTTYEQQMVEIEKQFGFLLSQLPADTEVPGLIEDVTKAGLTSGLEFKEIKLLPEVNKSYYVELPVKISLVGNYHSFANFTTKVAALPRIVSLTDFSIKPIKENDSSQLMISVLAKTYRYRGDVKL